MEQNNRQQGNDIDHNAHGLHTDLDTSSQQCSHTSQNDIIDQYLSTSQQVSPNDPSQSTIDLIRVNDGAKHYGRHNDSDQLVQDKLNDADSNELNPSKSKDLKSRDASGQDDTSNVVRDKMIHDGRQNNQDHLGQQKLNDTDINKTRKLPVSEGLQSNTFVNREMSNKSNQSVDDDGSGKISPSSSWIDSDSRISDHDSYSLRSTTSSNSLWSDIKLNEDGHNTYKDNLANKNDTSHHISSSPSQSSWLSMFRRKSSSPAKSVHHTGKLVLSCSSCNYSFSIVSLI